MNLVEVKPKKRSKLRIACGKLFYTNKRRIIWYLHRNHYSRMFLDQNLPHIAFTHQTPLLRKLQNVDIWYQTNKIINLKLAIKELDGLVIKPGETFSYWCSIGKPTKRKGYVDGMVLHCGKFMPGVGGGLCQLSNLLYWMTLHTTLTVTERYRHSFDVFPDSNRTQPFGSGATCAYNYLDLQIENKTSNTYQLRLKVTDSYLVGEWHCHHPQLETYQVYEGSHEMKMAFWGDYVRHNTIYRKVYNGQLEEIDDQFVAENYAIMMYQPYLENQEAN